MSGLVTHFEIYGDDLSDLADFYRDLFGWTIAKVPGIDYHTIQTGSSSRDGIRGGLQRRPIDEPRSWVHYVSVDAIDDAVSRVERLGGTVVRPKTAVPQTAWYAVVQDPAGNIFAVWQPDPTAYPPPLPD
ncbi:MAG: VOC family protein [Thermomicrobiales bacterium]|nr:VOC family protein [Thermomicrobiales bacterium]